MALDLYTQQDILNVLRATHTAGEGSTALAIDLLGDRAVQTVLDGAGDPVERQACDQELLIMYRRGFYTALSSVALAFGLVPATREPHGQGRGATARRPPGSEGALDVPGCLGFDWAEPRNGGR